jgi:hypothetical protein
MFELYLVLLTLAAGPEFGSAPKDTLDPIRSINRVGDLFRNCDFSAVQTRRSIQPSGGAFTRITEMKCKVCQDASVIQCKDQVIDQIGLDGNRMKDRVLNSEFRWIRTKPPMELELSIRGGQPWPAGLPPARGVGVLSVSVLPNHKHEIWTRVPIGDFLGELDIVSGLTLADMVADGGRRGYTLEKVAWASADHSSITYQFMSADYGTTTATFSKVGAEWMPSLIHIVRSAESKVFADRPSGAKDRVKNFSTFSDFNPAAHGLDRFDTVFTITYDSNRPLPASIEREDIYFHKDQQARLDTKIIFQTLRSGDVSCDEVMKTLLPIPDGCEVYRFSEPDLAKLAWTTKDGEVVNALDAQALAIGRRATFSSARTVGLVLTTGALAVLVTMLLYRHRQHFLPGRSD